MKIAESNTEVSFIDDNTTIYTYTLDIPRFDVDTTDYSIKRDKNYEFEYRVYSPIEVMFEELGVV
jgi:hypothetical protein